MVVTVIKLGDPTGYTCRRGNLVNPRSSRSTVVGHLIVELDGSEDSDVVVLSISSCSRLS